jgi:hypothetical protein
VVLSPQAVAGKPKKKLLDQVRDVMRLKHYSLRTERTYSDWITRLSVSTGCVTPPKWERWRCLSF